MYNNTIEITNIAFQDTRDKSTIASVELNNVIVIKMFISEYDGFIRVMCPGRKFDSGKTAKYVEFSSTKFGDAFRDKIIEEFKNWRESIVDSIRMVDDSV